MEIKKKIARIGFIGLQTILITGIVLFAVVPFSCKVSVSEGIKIIGGNYKTPVLEKLDVVDSKNVVLAFNEEILLKNLVVSPFVAGVSDSMDFSNSQDLSCSIAAACGNYGKILCNTEYSDDRKTVNLVMEQETEVGKKYEIFGIAEDKIGNTLMFCIPFTGFNSYVPELIITEVHNSMAGQLASETEKNIRRLEYVEFLALSDGNLIGLELCSGYSGDSKKYIFPAVEVKKGEVFLVHMRTWGEGCISEEDNNLTSAFSTYTGPYRDLWTENTVKPFGEKNDFLVLRNSINGEILDGVMYSDGSYANWADVLKTDYSTGSDGGGVFESCAISNAINSSKLSPTKVLQRKIDEGLKDKINKNEGFEYPIKYNKEDWSIGNPSPGSL